MDNQKVHHYFDKRSTTKGVKGISRGPATRYKTLGGWYLGSWKHIHVKKSKLDRLVKEWNAWNSFVQLSIAFTTSYVPMILNLCFSFSFSMLSICNDVCYSVETNVFSSLVTTTIGLRSVTSHLLFLPTLIKESNVSK